MLLAGNLCSLLTLASGWLSLSDGMESCSHTPVLQFERGVILLFCRRIKCDVLLKHVGDGGNSGD